MISVSILGEKDNYTSAIEKINSTSADFLHLDIMDNTFTYSKSFDLEQVKEIAKINNKKLDIHLMSYDIDIWLDECIKLKPDIISIHYEETENIDKYIKKIKNNNILIGIAINPDTLVSQIYNYLDKVDIVLVMGVYAGKAGQEYIESTTKKLKQLKQLQKSYKYKIEVDGGINISTIKEIKDYTDIVVSGSFITNSNDYQMKINELNA